MLKWVAGGNCIFLEVRSATAFGKAMNDVPTMFFNLVPVNIHGLGFKHTPSRSHSP